MQSCPRKREHGAAEKERDQSQGRRPPPASAMTPAGRRRSPRAAVSPAGRRRSAVPRLRSQDGCRAPLPPAPSLRSRQQASGASPAFRHQRGLEAGRGRPPAPHAPSLGAGRRAPSGDGPRRPSRPDFAPAPPRSGGRSAVSPPVSPPGPAGRRRGLGGRTGSSKPPRVGRRRRYRRPAAGPGLRPGQSEKATTPCSPSSLPDPPSGPTSCRRPR